MNFEYYMPTRLLFGKGKTDSLGDVVKGYGKKALLVTGTGSTKRSGLLDRSLNLLEKAGVLTIVFDKVTPNPLTDTVYKGASIAKRNGCDVILGIGGGSIMDAAKGIAFCAVNSGDVSDYIFGKKVGEQALPIVLVPTTCGTGSEGNQIAVLTNPDTMDKKALYTPIIFPKASIIDYEVMRTMPQSVLSAVGFDAFTHSLECFTGKRSNPITEVLAIKAMKDIFYSLPRLLENDADDKAWEMLSFAATMGGMNIGISGVSVAHGMEHPASGLRNIVHGKGLAAITPAVVERLARDNSEKFSVVSKILGGKNESDCAKKIREFLTAINLNFTLSDLGIEKQDISWMVENCLKISSSNIANTNSVLIKDDLYDIYTASL